jgi:hypothetical protein
MHTGHAGVGIEARRVPPSPATVQTQYFWSASAEQPMSANERNRVLLAKSGSEPQSQTCWVNDTVTRLRIDPHIGPCRFSIDKIELLEPVEIAGASASVR